MLSSLKTLAFLILSVLLYQTPWAVAGPERPNVVLIMADDLGYETLGCYGGISYRTPQLDRLARTGVRFNHAYAQPLCTNTRLQIMTGMYNHRNWVAFGILDPRDRTFGHLLQEAGYATCIAGKWQLQSYDPPEFPGAQLRRGIGMHPKDAGFNEYCLWHTGHTELKGSRYADPVILENGQFRKDTQGKYGEDVWVQFIGDFMQRHQQRPFFVYYPMALPHGPFVPTPDSPEWQNPDLRHQADRRFYKDMVEYMDKSVGQLVARIDELRLREKTLILFYGDNGTPREVTSRANDQVIHGGKGLTTDAGTRVPLIANWKGTAPRGAVIDDLVDSTDFLPTLLDLAGVSALNRMELDGTSFAPQLHGEKGKMRQWVYFHFYPQPGWNKHRYPTLQRFARDQRFKLYADGRFFDLSIDVLEQSPVTVDTTESARARESLVAVLDRMQDMLNLRADAHRRATGRSR